MVVRGRGPQVAETQAALIHPPKPAPRDPFSAGRVAVTSPDRRHPRRYRPNLCHPREDRLNRSVIGATPIDAVG